MKNEKIIIYLGNFTLNEINAAGKRVIGNSYIFSKLGYRVILIGKDKNPVKLVYPISCGDNIEYYSFSDYGYIVSSYMADVRRIIRKVGCPSIIIRYGSPGLAFFDKSLIRFCRKNDIKIFADVVDWLPATGNNFLFNTIKKIDTQLEKSLFNCQSDGVIAISSFLDKYYSERGCRTIVVPPLVSQYKKNNSCNKQVKVVYAGVPFRLGVRIKETQKVKDRLDICVEAISKISNKNVIFDVFGITKEQYLVAYPMHKDVLERSLCSIVFHGRQNMKVVQKMINNADYTILLRDRNRATMAGFPTKVVESLSCGTPVITTDTSDLRNYITEGENGFFVDVYNRDSLIKKLEEILSFDSSRRKELKDNCYRRQELKYTNYIESLSAYIKMFISQND